MPDCRFILDNISDMTALQGSLINGSDVQDLSGAEMTAGTDGWQVIVKTVAPAQQHPRLSVSVALYFDVDGRMNNNALAGPRLGADTVYGIAYKNGGWKITKESFDAKQNAFLLEPTNATYSTAENGYSFKIPYAEIPKTAPAYWKAGIGINDRTRFTVDYVPDVGMSCVPSLAPESGWKTVADKAKYTLDMGLRDVLVAVAVVLAAAIVIFFKWKKNRKKKT